MSRIPYTNKVGETIGSIADPAAAYSLRALNGGDPMVARVRRSSDDAEKDFTASDMDSGSVADWVNGKQDTTLPCDVASAAAAYSLRSVNSNYTGSVVRVRRSSDDAEKDFTASDVSGVSLVNWVNSAVDLVSSDLSDSTWTETGLGTATFSANALSGGTGPRQVLSNKVFPQGTKVRVQINLTANLSNNTQLGVHFYNVNNGSLTAITSNGAASRNIDSEFTLTADSKIRIRAEGGTTADWSFSNLSVTSILADGHVTTWYDQSGNGNNATQSTASSQPKIVDGGVLVSDGIEFDGAQMLDIPTSWDIGSLSSFLTAAVPIVGGNNFVLDLGNSAENLRWIAPWDNVGTRRFGYADNDSVIAISASSNTTLYTAIAGSTAGGFNGFANGLLQGTASLASGTPSSTSRIGARYDTQNPFTGSISEIIIYNSDQSSNRFKIESNINNHYGLYTNTNDGFVTTWYDQSGNDNHATQSTAGSQPKIVDGGVLVSDGIDFDGNNRRLDMIDIVSTIKNVSTFLVCKANNILQTGAPLTLSRNDPNLARHYTGFITSNNFYFGYAESATEISLGNADTNTHLFSTVTGETTAKGWLDGILGGTTSATDTYSALSTGGIGSINVTTDYNGFISEIIIYDSDQSANQAAIEANINNHYDIY